MKVVDRILLSSLTSYLLYLLLSTLTEPKEIPFPHHFWSMINSCHATLKRAAENSREFLMSKKIILPFLKDKHRKTDERPYGGWSWDGNDCRKPTSSILSN